MGQVLGDFDVLVRLAVACICGGIIGYERQAKNKTAGLRTNILVCLGSCLIMVLSINIYAGVQGLTNADPARLAAQVVSGIGFLGAGSIMASKHGTYVVGLTTAASLWVVAAVGLAVGSGHFVPAGITTLLVFITLKTLGTLEARLTQTAAHTIHVLSVDKPGQIGRIGTMLGEAGVSIRDMDISTENCRSKEIEINVSVVLPPAANIHAILHLVRSIEGIISVETKPN